MTEYLSAKLSNGNVEIIEKTLPEPDENAHIVKLLYSAVCRADVKALTGGDSTIFGHEIIGIYKRQHVTLDPTIPCNRTTGFAQYMVIDSKEPLFFFDGIDPRKAVLAEPFACVVNSYNRIEKYGKTAIIGAGNAGLIFSMLAHDSIIFNRGEERIIFARQSFPETAVYPLEDYENYSGKFDVGILCTSTITQEILSIGHSLLKKNGILHLYGGTSQGDNYLGVDIHNIRSNGLSEKVQGISISGIKGPDFHSAFELIGKYPLEKLISKEITLEQLPTVINGMASGELDYPGKVIVRY